MLASSTCSSSWTGTTTSTSGPAGAAAGWASGTRARVRMAAGCSSGGGSMPRWSGPPLGATWVVPGSLLGLLAGATGSQREDHPEARPPPGDGVDPDGAPVDGHQGGHDRQAEPGAAVGVGARRGAPPGPGSPTPTAAPGRPSRVEAPTRTSTGLPAGVWVSALLTRLARTCR